MSTKLVALATYDNVPLAELARLRLEQEGIPVQLENAELVNALWHYGNAFGHVRPAVWRRRLPDHDAAESQAVTGRPRRLLCH
jgi:hypothetical protein